MKQPVFTLSLSVLLGALAAIPVVAADGITIDTPLSGWRNAQGEQVLYTQEVSYPAVSVNTQDQQSELAVIQGRIASTVKHQEQPFKLIVNGIPMPLRVENGEFSRPYSFGSGSNNVEIRSPDGENVSRVQFYEAYVEKGQPKLRILLSWDSDGSDLDLHVLTPDGAHCYYGNRVLENGGALDVDVTTGYGPEIFATPAPAPGTYLVYVNYYGAGNEEDLTVAEVSIITHENTPDEKKQSFSVPMRHPGELTLAHSFVYP
jgi:uncharacterized protein YfaP (DUF2135 family)